MLKLKKFNKYYLPTKIYFGSGILKYLPDILETKGERVYLVVGKHVLKDKTFKKVKDSFPKIKIKVFSKIPPKPNVTQIENVRHLIRDFGTDLIIAIGGGSVLDTAKSAAILANNKGTLIDFLTKKRKLNKKGISFIAIPTTAGTGSEVTPWATIWGENKIKYSLSSPLMFPLAAICDPRLTLSMPPFLTACTGLDVLSQATEAYWSIHSTPFSDIHAAQGMSLAINNLENAVKKPKELFYREQMMLATIETGQAFSQTATTAVHSVSYPMTAFFNIPHGHACALTLSMFLKYNYDVTGKDCNDKRGPEFVKKKIMEVVKNLGCNTVNEACNKINGVMKSIGLETSLSKVGITDVETIIKHGLTSNKVANNPRFVTKKILRKLLEKIY
ncbi:MAG: hypothetical protein A2V69_01520 [Candidatus Portnoybacteria bacterium RBG_13_40_8]|uniref:Uncharacterized protein n=1 Tax=Candidatus Portnoybacteria bacterium RBG_13_40_8 TaxID=1801990 RepID=A0A1G2F6H6_9BACT|nr:MAG: hypothetical protein A2V69_01520 [Candidatus Portnoybacteria bacterium RBG_13_40_8]